MKKIKVGMLGYAFMGRAHTNAYNQMPIFFYPPPAYPVKEVVCGRNVDKVKEFASRFGWKFVETDWRKMIKADRIDLFDNCGPNNMHYEPNIAAAEEGIDIFCEKPLARNLKEAEEIAAAVRKAGVKAMCAFNYRRVPAIVLAKKLIEEGYLGKIYHWRAVYLQDWIRDPNFPLVWRLRSEEAGSGPHGDLNAHIVDLALYLVGDIDSVVGMEKTFIEERPLPEEVNKENPAKGKVTVEDACLFLARFKNGALGSFEATRFATGRRNYNSFEINGSKGSIIFNLERMNELQFYTDEDPEYARGFRTILVTEPVHAYVNKWWPPGHIIGWEHTFTHEVYDLFDAIVNDKPIHPDFEDALKVQRVLERVKESIDTGSWKSVE